MLRSISLKSYTSTQMIQNEDGEIVAYRPSGADLIRAILSAKKPNGFSISDLRQIMQILDALDTAADKDILLLNEEQYQMLNKMVNEHIWPVYDPSFIEFSDDIVSAKKVNPNT